MKKFIFLIIALFAFASCTNSNDVRIIVEEAYPNCIVYNVPDLHYQFIVVDSIGRIYYIKYNNKEISYRTLIHNK